MSRLRILSLSGLVAAFLFAAAAAQDKKDPPKETVKESPKETKKETPVETKKEAPKPEEPKKVEPKKEEPKKEAPKPEEPKKDAPKTEEPKKDAPKTEATLPFAWTFKLNESFYQEMTTTTNQNIKVQGLDVNQRQAQTFYFKWTPVKQEGDTWEVKQTIDGIKMTIDIAGNPVSFDSTVETPVGAGNSALTEFFKALKGAEFKLTINAKTMKVTKVEGRQAFLEKLSTANPQMKELLNKILSEESLKQMTDPSFGMMPEKPLGKDNTWETKSTLNLGPLGTYENTYKYTLKGKDEKNKDLDSVSVDLNMTYKPPTDSDPNLPFKIKSADLKTKDKQDGKILFNTKLGRLESSTITLKLNGTLVIEIGGTTTNVELTQDQTTTVKTSEKSLIPEKAPTPPKAP